MTKQVNLGNTLRSLIVDPILMILQFCFHVITIYQSYCPNSSTNFCQRRKELNDQPFMDVLWQICLIRFFFVFVKMFQVSLTWLRGEWHIVDIDPTCWISVSDLLTSHAAGALYETPLKGQQGQAHCQAHRSHGCWCSFSHFLIYLN